MLEKIPNEVFKKLSEDYLTEQKEVRINIPKMEIELENIKNSLTSADKFTERAKKFLDLDVLTAEILRSFVDKVVVEEKPVKFSRTADQKIKIYYRNIGYLGDYTEKSDIAEPQYDYEMSKNGELIAV